MRLIEGFIIFGIIKMLSESFYALLITTISTLFLTLMGIAYKSKCSSVKCLCLSLTRDVAGEELYDMNIRGENKV